MIKTKKPKPKKGQNGMPNYQKLIIALLSALLLANIYVLFSRTQINSGSDISDPVTITKDEAQTEGGN